MFEDYGQNHHNFPYTHPKHIHLHDQKECDLNRGQDLMFLQDLHLSLSILQLIWLFELPQFNELF